MQEELSERINKLSRDVTDNDDMIKDYNNKLEKLTLDKMEIEK